MRCYYNETWCSWQTRPTRSKGRSEMGWYTSTISSANSNLPVRTSIAACTMREAQAETAEGGALLTYGTPSVGLLVDTHCELRSSVSLPSLAMALSKRSSRIVENSHVFHPRLVNDLQRDLYPRLRKLERNRHRG